MPVPVSPEEVKLLAGGQMRPISPDELAKPSGDAASFLKSAGTGLLRGASVDTPRLIGQAAKAIGLDEIGNTLTEWADKVEKAPYLKAEDSTVQQAVESATQAILSRLAGIGIGAFAGSSIGGAPGGLFGAAAGGILTGAPLYALAEYTQFMEDAEKQGIPRDAVRADAVLSAIAEGGLQAASDLLLGRIFGVLGPKKMLEKPVKNLVARMISTTAKVAGEEVPTEYAQSYIETWLRNKAGIETPITPSEAGAEAAKIAAVASPIFGAIGAGVQGIGARPAKDASRTDAVLADLEKKYIDGRAGAVTPEEVTSVSKGGRDAEGLRKDARQIYAGRHEPAGGQAEGGQDLEQQASRSPGWKERAWPEDAQVNYHGVPFKRSGAQPHGWEYMSADGVWRPVRDKELAIKLESIQEATAPTTEPPVVSTKAETKRSTKDDARGTLARALDRTQAPPQGVRDTFVTALARVKAQEQEAPTSAETTEDEIGDLVGRAFNRLSRADVKYRAYYPGQKAWLTEAEAKRLEELGHKFPDPESKPGEALEAISRDREEEGRGDLLKAREGRDAHLRQESEIAELKATIEGYFDTKEIRQIKAARLDDQLAKVKELGDTLGVRVAFFEPPKSGPLSHMQGMFNRRNNTLYISKNAPVPHASVLGHELMHHIENNYPDLYEPFRKYVMSKASGLARYEDALLKRYKKAGAGEPEDVGAKFLADFAGDQFISKEFWRTFANEEPSLFRRIADIALQGLENIRGAISRIFKSEDYINDIDEARAELARLIADFSKESSRTGETEGRPQLSVFSESPMSEIADEIDPSSSVVDEDARKALWDLRDSRIAYWYDWLRGKQKVPVVLEKRHGPQVGHWFRTMSNILSQTWQGRMIYEAGRRFKENTAFQTAKWVRKYEEIVKDLSPREKRLVLNILDTQEEITGNHPVEVAAANLRRLLQEVRRHMIDHGVSVGYIEGYLPHIFQGRFWVIAKGKYSRKVNTLTEALKIANQMAEEGDRVTVVQDTFIPPDEATMLSRKAYHRLVSVLHKELGKAIPVLEGITREDISSLLAGQGIARPLPRKRFFGNLRERVVNNPNFLKDLDEVMRLYFYGASRKVHQDIFLRTVQEAVERMPQSDSRLRKFVENTYLPSILAHPTDFEEAVANALSKFLPGRSGQDVRRWLHNVNLVQYVMDLGLSASAAVANASQVLVNVYPIVGERSIINGYAKAVKTIKDPGLMREIEQSRVTLGVNSITGERLPYGGATKEFLRKIVGKEGVGGFMEATLMPFSGVEVFNRIATYWAGKDFALRELKAGRRSATEMAKLVVSENASLMRLAKLVDNPTGDWVNKRDALREAFAKRFAYELNEKTNFRIGRENLPMILQAAPIRLFSPYKSFLMNQLRYTVETLGPKGILDNPKKALRFVGMTFALAGINGNPILHAIFKAVNEISKNVVGEDIEKWLKDRGIHRGITGALGVDISGSVAVNLPKRTEELLGRFGRLALELARFAYQSATGMGTVMTERKIKRLSQPALVQRALDAISILEKGYYQTPVSKTVVKLREPPEYAAVKRIFGILPKGVAETFEMEEEIKRATNRYRSLSADLTERWASAMAEGDEAKANRVIMTVANRINKASTKLAHARNDRERMDALTELAFWREWMSNRRKFRDAMARKTIPRNVYMIKQLPKYMRPMATASE